MRLYFKYVAMQLKADLEYKKAFALSLFFKMLSAISALVSIVFLFDKFGSIADYKFEDVLICFVMSFLGFSLAECFFRSFDHFDRILSNGEFDRILVRPRSVILQVLGSEVEFNRIGRAVVAIVTFIILLAINPELLQPTKLITLILMIVGNIVVYAALFILKAGITFFYDSKFRNYEYFYRWCKRSNAVSAKYISKMGTKFIYIHNSNCVSELLSFAICNWKN